MLTAELSAAISQMFPASCSISVGEFRISLPILPSSLYAIAGHTLHPGSVLISTVMQQQ